MISSTLFAEDQYYLHPSALFGNLKGNLLRLDGFYISSCLEDKCIPTVLFKIGLIRLPCCLSYLLSEEREEDPA